MYRLFYDRTFYPHSILWMRWGVLLIILGALVISLPEILIAFVAGFLFLAGSFLVFLSLKVRCREKSRLKIIDHDYL